MSLIQLAQPAVTAGGNSTTATVTLGSTPTAQNIVIAALHSGVNATPSSSLSTTLQWSAQNYVDATNGQGASMLIYLPQATNATATFSWAVGSGAWSCVAAEYTAFPRLLGEEWYFNQNTQTASTSLTSSTLSPQFGGQMLVVAAQGIKAASTSFSSPTFSNLGGNPFSYTATKEADLNQATNTSNICLYDLFVGGTDPNFTGKFQGHVTASNSAVGMNTFWIVSVGAGASTSIPRIPRTVFQSADYPSKPHPFSPGNPR